MKIMSNNASVELSSNDKCQSFWISPELNGYAASLRFITGDWTILHVRKKDDKVVEKIVILPSDKWKLDLENDGYEIISTIVSATEPKYSHGVDAAQSLIENESLTEEYERIKKSSRCLSKF